MVTGLAPRRGPRLVGVGDGRGDLAEQFVLLLGDARVGRQDDVGRGLHELLIGRRLTIVGQDRGRLRAQLVERVGDPREHAVLVRAVRLLRDRDGTTPSASAASVLPQPQVATRSGAAGISVSPKACSMVIGNPSPAAASEPVSSGAAGEHPARARAAAAAAARTAIVRRACMNSLSKARWIEVSLT
jgi:hypothetical protein